MKIRVEKLKQMIREASIKHPLPRGTTVMLKPFEDSDGQGPYTVPAEEAVVVWYSRGVYVMKTKLGACDVPEDQIAYVLTN